MPPDGLVERTSAGTSLADASILMLDDDPTMRVAVSNTLKAAGCQSIQHTGNGHEALRMVSMSRIDLILCDCQMPAMDGMSFLRALRELPTGADIPVLMLTVNQNAKDAWEARQLKVAGWLVKPVAPQNVVAQVAATLGRLPPRIRENLLSELVELYEAELPQQVVQLGGMAAALVVEAEDFDQQLDALYRRMHQVKGQAGTMGYQLLGDLAGLLHDVLRSAVEIPEAATPHRAELVKLVRVGIAGMKLVADRRLRGDGGAVGERMRSQLGDFAGGLAAKLAEAAAPAARGGRRAL
jgi:CheY-like chemotaxis protein